MLIERVAKSMLAHRRLGFVVEPSSPILDAAKIEHDVGTLPRYICADEPRAILLGRLRYEYGIPCFVGATRRCIHSFNVDLGNVVFSR